MAKAHAVLPVDTLSSLYDIYMYNAFGQCRSGGHAIIETNSCTSDFGTTVTLLRPSLALIPWPLLHNELIRIPLLPRLEPTFSL